MSVEEEDRKDLVDKDEKPKATLWKPEWDSGRLVACAALFLIAHGLNGVVVAINHDLVWRHPLVDLTGSWVRAWRGGALAGFICMLISSAAVGLLLLVHRARLIIVRRWLFLTGTLTLFRGLCLAVTQLPPAFVARDSTIWCHPVDHNRTLSKIIARLPYTLFVPDFTSDKFYCGDGMFSGKILFILSNCYTFNYYTPSWAWPLRWALILITGTGFVAALLSRLHYTSDIFLSYVVTTGCYTIYHTFCEIPGRRRAESAYGRLWMFWIMTWLEEGVPAGRLRNTLSWPWTRPASAKAKLAHWNTKCEGPCCSVIRALRKYRFKTKL